MSTLIQATALLGYNELVQQLGYDPAQLLRQFHLAADLPGREDGALPLRTLIHLLQASAEEFACPDFGLRLAEHQGIEILGPVALIARYCDSVGEAIEAISRYLYVHSPGGVVTLDRSDKTAPRVLHEIGLSGLPHKRHAEERAMVVGQNILTLLMGGSFAARAVLFTHSTPIPQARYREIFKTEVLFNQPVNAFILKPEDLQYPLAQKDPYLKRFVTEQVTKTAAAPRPHLAVQIRGLVRQWLPTGHCTIRVLAEQLCLHPRTLQRRLTAENLSFEHIVDEVRKECVAEYLMNASIPLSQLTGLIGYTEQSSLNRACQRWFRMSPGQLRVAPLARPAIFP